VVKHISGYFYGGPTRVLRSFPPGSRGNRHPTGTEMTENHFPKWPRRETGTGDDDIDFTAKTSNIDLFHLTILQTQDPEGSSYQTDPTTRSVDQGHLTVGEKDGKGYSGETDPTTQVPDRSSPTELAGKQHRIGEMAGFDPVDLGRADTSGGDSFGDQPIAKTFEPIQLLRSEDMSGVLDGTS
jgi:hypothetical protein